MRIHINQTQCGFVIKNGCYQKMIFAGTYYYPACMGYKVVIEEMRGRVSFKEVPLKVLKEDKVFLSRVTIAEVPEGQLGVLYINHAASAVVTDREAAYWNVWEPCELRMIDMREPAMDRTVEKSLLRLIDQQYYKKIEILPGEKGLLYQDNILTDELGPGTYYYWLYARDVLCRVVDLKMKELEISGQEILTADRVGIRLNLTATYRIADPRRLVETIKGVENQLYTRIQLIVREYIGRYRLDEILEQKEAIAGFLAQRMREEQEQYCVEVQTIGIKDIILPGEIRDIMNTVLIAEKRAQANVITRREEVASTRSLLNTAKLMEENKTLYKLKELECLERICTQVGNISVAGSVTLIQQLKELLGT